MENASTASIADARALYFDLMKRCLIDSIFADDPLADFVPYRPKPATAVWKRAVISALEFVLVRYRLRLVEPYSIPWISDFTQLSPSAKEAAREMGAIWPARAHSMIGRKRLDNLQQCVEIVLRDHVPGDLIETGAWRGGACILMRAILKAYGDVGRTVWVADSFAGLPPPKADQFPADANDKFHTFGRWLAVSREQVEETFRRYGLLDSQVQFLEGWFTDTLPNAPVTRLAILRLDGDMYESTMEALNALYDKLSPGGFVIVDDYDLKPCAQAITDFRESRAITDTVRDIDGRGVFWRRAT